MARLLTAKDVTGIMNLLYRQATGRDDIANVDLSNFASVGEQVLATGKENVLNSLSIVLGKTIGIVGLLQMVLIVGIFHIRIFSICIIICINSFNSKQARRYTIC